MRGTQFKLRMVALAVAALGAFAPVAYSSDRGLITSSATCEDGTCCPEDKSLCIINGIISENSYDKGTEGSCKKPPSDN